MTVHSEYLSILNEAQRADLEKRLQSRQTGRCFICENSIDRVLHQGQLEVDHIEPLAVGGADEENNFALVHTVCNRNKGASDLRIARRMAEFERLQKLAQDQGNRGVNLGHVLERHGGAKHSLRFKKENGKMAYALNEIGDTSINEVPIYYDKLSDMTYCFVKLPLEYLHHDDRINPRPIGSNIRGLIEEFMRKRPQLQVSLAWWAPGPDGTGQVKVFDGQHKAAAQILLGTRELPVRLFIEPDINVLLQANTNAGDKLRQVAFDAAVIRHLGSTLYSDRVRKYQEMKGLKEDDYHFSEKDLVSFFRGEHREITRYIVDAVRDGISHNKENKLMEFVEWSGKGADRPLAYATISRTFFSEFLCKKALSTAIDEGFERGENPRQLEKEQFVKLMNLFADIFFVSLWDPDIGGRRVEMQVQKGDPIPEMHLRAWRIAREEIMGVIFQYVRLVIEQYYAWTGKMVDKERLLQYRMSDDLWDRLGTFLRNLSKLPCWIDRQLSTTVFGAKQNRDYWMTVFYTGKSPSGVPVLAQPIDLNRMIQK